MIRYKIAHFIALVASAITVIGFSLEFLPFYDTIMKYASPTIVFKIIGIGVFIGFVSYFFAGIISVIKHFLGYLKWGFFALPFPISIVTLFFAISAIIVVFFFLPIIPVGSIKNRDL